MDTLTQQRDLNGGLKGNLYSKQVVAYFTKSIGILDSLLQSTIYEKKNVHQFVYITYIQFKY